MPPREPRALYMRSDKAPLIATRLRQIVRTITHQLLAGDFGAHRRIPVDDEEPDPEEPAPVPVEARRVYTKIDAQRAWARRRADLQEIAGIDDVLAQIDARAKELEQRTCSVLAQNTPAPDQRNR